MTKSQNSYSFTFAVYIWNQKLNSLTKTLHRIYNSRLMFVWCTLRARILKTDGFLWLFSDMNSTMSRCINFQVQCLLFFCLPFFANFCTHRWTACRARYKLILKIIWLYCKHSRCFAAVLQWSLSRTTLFAKEDKWSSIIPFVTRGASF